MCNTNICIVWHELNWGCCASRGNHRTRIYDCCGNAMFTSDHFGSDLASTALAHLLETTTACDAIFNPEKGTTLRSGKRRKHVDRNKPTMCFYVVQERCASSRCPFMMMTMMMMLRCWQLGCLGDYVNKCWQTETHESSWRPGLHLLQLQWAIELAKRQIA